MHEHSARTVYFILRGHILVSLMFFFLLFGIIGQVIGSFYRDFEMEQDMNADNLEAR